MKVLTKLDSYSKFIFTVTQQITKIDVSYVLMIKRGHKRNYS